MTTAISKSVHDDYDYHVTKKDLENWKCMFTFKVDYFDAQGINFGGMIYLDKINDKEMINSFELSYEVKLFGSMTIKEAIKKFNL